MSHWLTLFATTKSRETNSIDLVGWTKIFPRTVLFSTSDCVVVDESIITRNLSRPASACILCSRGVTAAENDARVASRFCSKRIVLAISRTWRRISMRSRRTLTRSRDDAAICSVFWPQITSPEAGFVPLLGAPTKAIRGLRRSL